MQIGERSLRRILSFAKKHPEAPIPKKNSIAGRPTKVSLGAIRQIKRKVSTIPTITARDLKKSIPQLDKKL